MTDNVTAEQIAINRAAWIAALRSGKYAQGYGALRVRDGYCCLGVAEDLRDPTCWQSIDDQNPLHATLYATYFVNDVIVSADDWESVHLQFTGLTRVTRRWLGVTESDPYVTVHASAFPRVASDGSWSTQQLSSLNDDHGFSFASIADVIADQPTHWTGDVTAAASETQRRNQERQLPGSHRA